MTRDGLFKELPLSKDLTVGGENQEKIQAGKGILGLEIKSELVRWVNNVEAMGPECGLKRGEQWMRLAQ